MTERDRKARAVRAALLQAAADARSYLRRDEARTLSDAAELSANTLALLADLIRGDA